MYIVFKMFMFDDYALSRKANVSQYKYVPINEG